MGVRSESSAASCGDWQLPALERTGTRAALLYGALRSNEGPLEARHIPAPNGQSSERAARNLEETASGLLELAGGDGERVAGVRVAGLVALEEPAFALLAGPVGEQVGAD